MKGYASSDVWDWREKYPTRAYNRPHVADVMTSFADAIFVCEKRGTHAYTAGETSARGITRQMTLLAAGAVSKVRRLYSDGYDVRCGGRIYLLNHYLITLG